MCDSASTGRIMVLLNNGTGRHDLKQPDEVTDL